MSYFPFVILMYLEEIKNRIFLSIVAWLTCSLINYAYLDNLLYIMIKPCLYECENDFYFIFTDVSEPFYTNINLILSTSNQLLYLFLYFHFVIFIKPGLYNNEYNYIKSFTLYGSLLFIVYFKINYNLLIPWSFLFFFNHQKQQKIDFFFEAKMDEYIGIFFFAYKLSVLSAVVCILLLSSLINNNKLKYLAKLYRKYFYILIITIASIVTPPDIVSQIILSFIIIIIFEIINYIAIIYIKLDRK